MFELQREARGSGPGAARWATKNLTNRRRVRAQHVPSGVPPVRAIWSPLTVHNGSTAGTIFALTASATERTRACTGGPRVAPGHHQIVGI